MYHIAKVPIYRDTIQSPIVNLHLTVTKIHQHTQFTLQNPNSESVQQIIITGTFFAQSILSITGFQNVCVTLITNHKMFSAQIF